MSNAIVEGKKSMNYQAKLWPVALGAALVAGCAVTTTPELEDARAAYQRASTSEFVAKNAPVSLYEAQISLQAAEKTLKDGDRKDADALAYVALRRAEIAEQLAAENAAQQALAGMGTQRTKALLEARDAELAALKAKQTDRGLMITIEDVLFEFGKADVKPSTVRELGRLVSLLIEYPERNLLIEGHTDSVGSVAANMSLSQRRADAVAKVLVDGGVGRSRITTRGLGKAYPVASNETAAGRQQNRRVEIYILKEGQTGDQAVR